MDNASAEPKPETISSDAPAPSPLPPKRGPFFERADWQSGGLTAFLIFIVYLFTLSPSIDLGWGGILSTAAMYGGVPHPPGFPFWTMYAHVFTTIIPFSNIAWRVSVSSAFASAVACGLIALTVSRSGALMLQILPGLRRYDPVSEKWLRILAGYAAGMSFGLSSGVWAESVIASWWPLNFALLAILVCLLIRWSYTTEKHRYLYAAILAYMPMLTNDRTPSQTVLAPAIVIFILFVSPALARDMSVVASLILMIVVFSVRGSVDRGVWYIYLALAVLSGLISLGVTIKTRQIFSRWKTTLGCLFVIVLGLLVNFYSPVASMTNPPMNWAYPRTVEGFLHSIARGQYERIHLTVELNRYWMQIEIYWDYISRDYGWVYLIPAAIPLLALHRMHRTERRWMFGLLVLFLCESFFLLALLDPSNDKASRDLHRACH